MANVLKAFFIKPALIKNSNVLGMVRDPVTFQFLKDEGENKPQSTYWLRRVKFKDVVVCSPSKKKVKKIESQSAQEKDLKNDHIV